MLGGLAIFAMGAFGLLDMRPSSSIDNSLNNGSCCVELASYRPERPTRFSKLAHFLNLLYGEASAVVGFTPSYDFGVQAHSISISSGRISFDRQAVFEPRRASAFFIAIFHILLMAAQKEMLWVYTSRIVTGVANKNIAIQWQRVTEYIKGNSGRQEFSIFLVPQIDCKTAIPFSGLCVLPFPAVIGEARGHHA